MAASILDATRIRARMRSDREFDRTQTLLQGAPCCDFRWRRKAGAK